ncbi:hypothetical protein IKO50_05695, partial [bacterium]|nr:hypothetical protein [bacterium]
EAKLVVFHAKQLTELTRSEKELCSGDLNVAMITSVAPVLMAGMFKFMDLTMFIPLMKKSYLCGMILKRKENGQTTEFQHFREFKREKLHFIFPCQ